MRIHLIGGPGSGKTYMANQLKNKHSVPSYDLDDIYWDDKTEMYGEKRQEEERDSLFQKILKKKDWIIEGVYTGWIRPSFDYADKIILIKTPLFVRNFRIFRRFIKRKFGLEKSVRKETWKGMRGLLRWSRKYEQEYLPEVEKLLNDNYSEKLLILSDSDFKEADLNRN